MLNGCRRARGAAYQHSNRRGCHRGTREIVLREIESWARDFKKSPVFWLNGLAGTGKSTIAQTIAERAFASGLLGASFFCSRDFEDRSDLHLIFPTIAFQLAHKYPSFQSRLISLLQLDPDIVDESLCSQMERLIVQPLQSAGISTVVVIDALDECKDEEPSSAILSVLGRFVERIPSVKFFITGRPEPRIKTGFRLPLLVDSTDVFVLHDVHPPLVSNDIRLYLKHELSGLARRRSLDRWPSDEHIDLLCHRAAGLFVYAVATAKFLDSKTHLPKQRLDAIINLPECTVPEGKTRFKPNTTLDSLYTSILEMAFSEEDPEVDAKLRSTLGAVVLLVNPLPPSGIAELIGLDPEEVKLFLTWVQSLVVFDENSNLPIKPFHKSFPDFITDPSRCHDTRFYVSPESLHLELSMGCLRLMNDGLERNLVSIPDYALNSEVKDVPMRIKDRVNVALQYACRSWHSHLTKTKGDVTGAISCLRFFLEEKFLAWLEMASILGAVGVTVVALEKLLSWLQEVRLALSTAAPNSDLILTQVSGGGQLLEMARDYFHFVTKFFEVISISATHIYHSALELSPPSSIVRRLYYHQRLTLVPRVVAGTPDAWDQSITISGRDYDYISCTWSPCGRFVAVQTQEAVEIRDPLAFELLSTFAKPSGCLIGGLAYSPDGRSLACLSNTALIIWDIQTGGVAKTTRNTNTHNASLLWSLDGRAIGIATMNGRGMGAHVYAYDVASGSMTQFPGVLRSGGRPHLWAHNNFFQIMTAAQDGEACTVKIQIFEVGPVLTRDESFPIQSGGGDIKIESYSPTTHHVSISTPSQLVILDVRNSRRLLKETGEFSLHIFSTDGNLFAASQEGVVRIWKNTPGCYTPWKEYSYQDGGGSHSSLLFSPTSSSILGLFGGILQVWRLYDHPTAPRDAHRQLAAISRDGTYIATAQQGHCTITITSLLSHTPSQFIDGYTKVQALVLVGNTLLVVGLETIVAWHLTEWGTVVGVLGDKRADQSDSVWIIPRPLAYPPEPTFSVGDQIGAIKYNLLAPHVYHTETGEVLQPLQAPPHSSGLWHSLTDMCDGRHHLRYRRLGRYDARSDDNWPLSRATLREGWVKDPEGKHRLWLPLEWRTYNDGDWFYEVAILQLKFPGDKRIVIRF